MAGFVTGSTGIVVTVPEAESLVADLRDRFDPAARYAVPAHITVLFPWLPIDAADEAARRSLGELAAATPAFDAELTAVGRFPMSPGWRPARPSPSSR